MTADTIPIAALAVLALVGFLMTCSHSVVMWWYKRQWKAHMTGDWVITDVKPHVMLCPLPERFWWEVEFIMALNSCHMTLHHGHWWNVITRVGQPVVVLDISDKTVDQITRKLIEGSYEVWQDYFRKVDSRQKDWIDTAREVEHQLQRNSRTKTKFKINRWGSK